MKPIVACRITLTNPLLSLISSIHRAFPLIKLYSKNEHEKFHLLQKPTLSHKWKLLYIMKVKEQHFSAILLYIGSTCVKVACKCG